MVQYSANYPRPVRVGCGCGKLWCMIRDLTFDTLYNFRFVKVTLVISGTLNYGWVRFGGEALSFGILGHRSLGATYLKLGKVADEVPQSYQTFCVEQCVGFFPTVGVVS